MHRPIVAVTGAMGFIGRHLIEALVAHDYVVRAIDLDRHFTSISENPAVEFRAADLRLLPEATAAIDGSDVCIALAADSGGVGYFNRYPAKILRDNCLIISNTLAAVRDRQVPRVIYISSSCIFDRASSPVATESLLATIPIPSPGYPFSKLVGEVFCRAYAAECGISYTIVRPFNVYGPGEFPGYEWGDAHVIPDLLEKILLGVRPIPIFGSGLQTRSFTHVTDIAAGIVRALELPQASHNQDFNFGTPEETTILALLTILWNLAGYEGEPPTLLLPPFQVDPLRRAIDISKAQVKLGWSPSTSLLTGLTEYVAWYREARCAMISEGRCAHE